VKEFNKNAAGWEAQGVETTLATARNRHPVMAVARLWALGEKIAGLMEAPASHGARWLAAPNW